MAHHGQNELNGRPVIEYIKQIECEVERVETVEGIADYIEQAADLDKAVRTTLAKIAAEGVKCGCGFWVAGYGPCDSAPALVEVFWSHGGRGNTRRGVPSNPLFFGGDGQSIAEKVCQAERFEHGEDAVKWSLRRWEHYLDQLYEEASRSPGASNVFGGARSGYLITAENVMEITYG